MNTLINSGRQAEKCRIIRRVPNFMLGEQPGTFCVKNTTKKELLTNELIPTNNILINSAQQAET
jgi:hypothetical protein